MSSTIIQFQGGTVVSSNWELYSSKLISRIRNLDASILSEAVVQLRSNVSNAGTIWIIGNGGSAATASHFCVDLSKGASIRTGQAIRAIPLMDLVPLQSAWSNDHSYEFALAETLQNFGKKSDLLFAISGSGNSPNILNCIKVGRKLGIESIGLTGFTGGKMRELLDLEINVACDDMQIIEDVHHAICHFLSKEV